ncbi:RAD52 DNA repair protein, partial [Dipodascopsis tothii]|uniref:RAD52 DNA repair protein n=1 Tax=Dipodascopsis tothii TaxID=44089 RepID=UPI0034CE3C2E
MPNYGDQHRAQAARGSAGGPGGGYGGSGSVGSPGASGGSGSGFGGGWTTTETEAMRRGLERQLGPEYISVRPAPGGARVHYLEGWKAINLANEVFGFNGWSSEIKNVQVDYMHESSEGRVHLGLSVTVRVTLRDGAFHEDIGYGHVENARAKHMAFDKCKKEATTDALKRALRSFGNVLGNCLYDANYIKNVTKVAVPPRPFDPGLLHR